MKISDLKRAKAKLSGNSQASGEAIDFLTTIVTFPFVTRQYIRDERPVIDCFDPTNGEVLRAVPVVSLSAGGDGGFRAGTTEIVYSNIDNLRESAQAYVIRTGKRKDPICLGFLFKEKRKTRKKRRARRTAPATPTAPVVGNDVKCTALGDIDVTGTHPADTYISQGDSILLIDRFGTIVLDNKESQQADGRKTINVQLAETGSLRISRVPKGGQITDAEANERVLLGKATRKFIDGRDPYTGTYEKDTLGAYVASLEARIEALENALSNFVWVNDVAVAGPDNGANQYNNVFKPALSAAQATAELTYTAKWGSPYPSQPRSSSEIEAASVRISEQGLEPGECN